MGKTIGNNKIGFKDEIFFLSKAWVGGGVKFWMDNHVCLQVNKIKMDKSCSVPD